MKGFNVGTTAPKRQTARAENDDAHQPIAMVEEGS
jgi:hypothetical protein